MPRTVHEEARGPRLEHYAGRAQAADDSRSLAKSFELRSVVATLGTALTRDHIRLLKRLCDVVVLLFDGDAAGQRAADRAVELFFADRSFCQVKPVEGFGRTEIPQ